MREGVANGVLFQIGPAEFLLLPTRKNDSQRLHVFASSAVLECACAGRVTRYRPADSRLLFAGRIRSEQQAARSGFTLYVSDQRARFDSHRTRRFINLRYSIEAAHREQNALVRYRRGCCAGLRASRRHRNSILLRPQHHFGYIFDRCRTCDEIRYEPQTRRIGLIGFTQAFVAEQLYCHPGLKQTTAADETSGNRSSDSRTASLMSPSTETAASACPPCARRA